MCNSWILSAIALLSLSLGTAATKHVSALAAQVSLYIRATNKTICGSETGSSGLITNWYCEGSAPQCCRDSRETLKEGIPWNCIPADGVCCGHGDYCSASINAICKRDKSGYECWAGSGAEVPTIVGNTPEMESDYSNVRGHKDEGEYESSATKSAWKAEVWAAWGMIGVGALWFL